MTTDISSLPAQICFEKDGYIFCNYVIQKGRVILSKRGWLRFKADQKEVKKELSSNHDENSYPDSII